LLETQEHVSDFRENLAVTNRVIGCWDTGSASPAKIYARGSYSVGAADISKAQFNGIFKEVSLFLPPCTYGGCMLRDDAPVTGEGTMDF
jgi:hypothetical protein